MEVSEIRKAQLRLEILPQQHEHSSAELLEEEQKGRILIYF